MPHPFGTTPHPALALSRAPRIGRHWAYPAALTALVLAACSTTPLPPWPARTAPAPQPQRGVVVPPPLGAPRPGAVLAPLPPVVATPVPAAQPIAMPPPPQAGTLQDLPYSAAVAARFPEPNVRYNTPGLHDNRRAFTSNGEIDQWLDRLAQAPSDNGTAARLLRLGPSQRGTSISALVLTRARDTDPETLLSSRRPTVLLIGQQHGDEPAGSEALLVVAEELAHGLLEPLLDKINVIIVPRANPDGADAGTRTTANGVDLDADHLLLSTPEARVIAALTRDYRPTLVLDAREFTVAGLFLQKYNGLQRHDALLQYATTPNLHEFLTKSSKEWYHDPMVRALKDQGLSTEWFHTTSPRPDDMAMSMGGVQPDTSRNVQSLKNAISLEVHTRGVGIGRNHIQRRVHTHITAISSALRSTVERASSLEQVRSYITRDTIAQACRDKAVLNAAQTPGQREMTLLHPDTGADQVLHVDWNSSLTLRTLTQRARPCGYWLAPESSAVVERLRLLGLQVLRVAETGSLLAETYQDAPQGTSAHPQVTLQRSAIDVPAGSYYVPLNQTLAPLAMAALEPDTPYSYFTHRLIDRVQDTARVMTTPSLVFEDLP